LLKHHPFLWADFVADEAGDYIFAFVSLDEGLAPPD
jgi:hypothetical protein